jgi:hypothetical protein
MASANYQPNKSDKQPKGNNNNDSISGYNYSRNTSNPSGFNYSGNRYNNNNNNNNNNTYRDRNNNNQNDNTVLVTKEELEERFTCAVCHSILTGPYSPDICQHVFCRECLFNCFAQCKSCPLCRKTYNFKNIRLDKKIENELKVRKFNCNTCGTKVKLCDLNEHNNVCDDTVSPKTATSMASSTDASSLASSSFDMTSFTCPYCSQSDLNFNALRTHCNYFHKDDTKEMVCPICASMPWGDPKQKSIDFIQHLNFRHAFEYENYLTFDGDEEIMEQQVILNSYMKSMKI